MPYSKHIRADLEEEIYGMQNPICTHPFDEWNPYLRAAADRPLYGILMTVRRQIDIHPRAYNTLRAALLNVPSVVRRLPAALVALFIVRDDAHDPHDDFSDPADIKAALLRQCVGENDEVSCDCHQSGRDLRYIRIREQHVRRIEIQHDTHPLSDNIGVHGIECNPWISEDHAIRLLRIRHPWTNAGEFMLGNRFNLHPSVATIIDTRIGEFRGMSDCLVECLHIAPLVRIVLDYKGHHDIPDGDEHYAHPRGTNDYGNMPAKTEP